MPGMPGMGPMPSMGTMGPMPGIQMTGRGWGDPPNSYFQGGFVTWLIGRCLRKWQNESKHFWKYYEYVITMFFFEIFGSLLDSVTWRDVSCCLFAAVCCPVPRLFCC